MQRGLLSLDLTPSSTPLRDSTVQASPTFSTLSVLFWESLICSKFVLPIFKSLFTSKDKPVLPKPLSPFCLIIPIEAVVLLVTRTIPRSQLRVRYTTRIKFFPRGRYPMSCVKKKFEFFVNMVQEIREIRLNFVIGSTMLYLY